MRTRESNKTKHFTYAPGEAPEEEPGGPAAEDAMDVDEEAGRRRGNDDENDYEAAEDEPALAGIMSDEGDDFDDGDDNAKASTTSRKKAAEAKRRRAQRRSHAAKLLAASQPDYHVHEVPKYPVDLRATRIYVGPLRRWHRFRQLAEILYGPDEDHLDIVYAMMNQWCEYRLLPSKRPSGVGAAMPSPWLPQAFEFDRAQACLKWYRAYLSAGENLQRAHRIPSKHAERFVPLVDSGDELVVLLGPHDDQKESKFKYGQSCLLSQLGAPVTDPEPKLDTLNGWIFDVGGLVLSLGWAPLPGGSSEQLLALGVVPHSDQVYHETDEETKQDEERDGCIQFWRLQTATDEQGIRRPSTAPPERIGGICFDWGRPKRLQWCPAPLRTTATYGILAALCGDGLVRVVAVPVPKAQGQDMFDWIDEPMATLGITSEYAVTATCLTWCGTNRLCLGHSDGSITLWSVYPCRFLARHPVHISQVLDISSGYPSRPYMISSTPVGGCPTVTDLALPAAESTYVPLLGGVSFQPNLLDWNDHLQGWFGIYPSPTPYNTIVGFAHVRFAVQSRTLVTLPAGLTCLAAGKAHPYLLVGCADGSVWALNAIRKLMAERGEEGRKLRVLQHEFRDAPGSAARGAARILQGFLPEANVNPRTEHVRVQHRAKKGPAKAKVKGRKGKGKAHPPREAEEGQQQGADPDDGEGAPGAVADDAENGGRPRVFEVSRAAIYHPWSRITALAWNPNVELGCLAAVAMGSGLVRIMDLGVEWASDEAGDAMEESRTTQEK